jgi:hypothetical protein
MKTCLVATIFLALAVSAPATITPCPTALLTVYLAPGFTCSENGLTQSITGYTHTGSAPDAGGVMVTPDFTLGNEGFQFSGLWDVVGSGQLADSLISGAAGCADGSKCLHDLSLFFDGSVTGKGSTTVVENYCLNGGLVGCQPPNSGQIHVTEPPPHFNDTVFTAAATSVSWSKDIGVSSGTCIIEEDHVLQSGPCGTASISQINNNFSNATPNQLNGTPEPISLGLVGIGLVGLGLIRHVKKQR